MGLLGLSCYSDELFHNGIADFDVESKSKRDGSGRSDSKHAVPTAVGLELKQRSDERGHPRLIGLAGTGAVLSQLRERFQ